VTAGREWRLDLPMTKPLSLNSRQHYLARARAVAAVRRDTRDLALLAGLPALERCAVAVHYRPRDRRRRDALNLALTLKACEDGLVDAGVVPDDTAEYVEPHGERLVLDEPSTEPGPRVYVIVRELS
jgi:crossover junction endodeoxyribonuclease RusA